MGVPKFFRWLSERYPQINQVITDSALLPEFDHLYLDMNGIIHGCTHPAHLDISEQLTEKDMMLGIMHYIDRIVTQIVKPKVSVYMAIDGVAPRAKMNQQRSRRFRSAKDMADQLKEANKENLRALLDDPEAKAKGNTNKNVFDSNCITPGTEFLTKVSEHIKYFIRKKLKEDPLWTNLKVYYSGPEVPGEGEHKIMQHIREMKASPDYRPNTRHCMYGQDADLIMLGLVTHEPHFTLLREIIDFNSFKRDSVNSATKKAVKKFTKQSDFQLLHLSILREYLQIDFAQGTDKSSFELESVIDDFVFLTFLVGNDFLPHMPALDIGDGAFDLLFGIYKDQRKLWGQGQYLVHAGSISDPLRLEAFLTAVGKSESETLEKKEATDAAFMNKQRKFNKHNKEGGNIPSEEELAANEESKNADYISAIRSLNISGGANVIEGWKPSPGKKDFKGRYYYEKLKLLPTHVSEHETLRKAYIEGLMWCLAYYYRGCISWGWFYPYHYGPMLSDLINLPSIFKCITFDLGEPFLPFQQLMGCLPPASSVLVPRIYRNLMCDQSSPVIEFYPNDFLVDMNGKRNPWEGVNLLPFIDGILLKKAIAEHCPDTALTAEERSRNRIGEVFLYTHDLTATDIVPSCNREIGLLDIPNCHSKVESISWSYRTDLVFTPEVIPGTKIPYPGFPSLNVLPIIETGLNPIGVNCFGSSSKYSTMVLNLRQLPELPGAKELAPKVLGQTLFINWPMMHEARVVAISDSKCEVRANGNKKFTDMMTERWEEESLVLKNQYLAGSAVPGSGGVNINDVQIRLKVVVLQGMKSFPDGSTKKVFGKIEADIPLQMALWASPSPDPRFIESGPKSMKDLYPKDSQVVLTKGKHKGCKGIIIGVSGDGKDATVVAKVHVMPPEPPFGLAIAKSVQDSYLSSEEACKLLNIKPVIFGKITGSLYVNPGRYDLGLNLKYKKELYVLGYTRMKDTVIFENKPKQAWVEGDSLLVVGSSRNSSSDIDNDSKVVWQYTPKAIRLVAAYREAFPDLFVALNRAPPNDRNYDARTLLGGKGIDMLPRILDWLKSIETATLPRVPASSVSIPKAAVLAIQRAAEVRSSALSQKKSVKDVNLKLPPSALFRENTATPTTVMTSSGPPTLGDRVVNLCANGLTFGARGTVVGIHMKSGCVEVVMDEEFIGGSTLQGTCSNFRGKLCVWAHLLKLSASETTATDDFSPKIAMKLPVECLLPTDKSKTSNLETSEKNEKTTGNTSPRANESVSTQTERNSSTGRSDSSIRKQGAWREAKGPPEKGSGFQGLKGSRKVKNGHDAWKKSVTSKEKRSESQSSTSELKAILGVFDKVAPSGVETASPNPVSSVAGLKALLGVGETASNDHQTPVYQSNPPHPSSATDMLAMMMMKNANLQSNVQPQAPPPAFNFDYIREGEKPSNPTYIPRVPMAVGSAMPVSQSSEPTPVPRVKKNSSNSARIVPSSVVKK